MRATLVDYVRLVRPWLARPLVSRASATRIEAMARLLPPCPVGGFECHLGHGPAGADLQVQLPRHAVSLPMAGSRRAWRVARDFHRASLTDAPLRRCVDDVGLEFDLHRSATQAPAVFAALDHDAARNARRLAFVASRLLGRPVSRALSAQLRTCIDALPHTAAIRFIGAMLSRPVSALRLDVCDLGADRAAEYLRAAGWPHSVAPVASLLVDLGALTDSIVLCLDVTDHILPRIGIECILERQPPEEPRWSRLLAHLRALDLCTDEQADAVLGWPGATARTHEAGAWPGSLGIADRLMGSDAASVVARYVSHLKVLYRPDHALEAKAYLGFFHRWVDVTAIDGRPHATDAGTDAGVDGGRTRRPSAARPTAAQRLADVRSYWDETTHLYLQHGTTFQGGLVATPGDRDGARANNLYLASRAGIRSGDRILDAGCGVCGPGIDIARGIRGVRIDAVTLSPIQAAAAQRVVRGARLANRIAIHVCDYHRLPFRDLTFDVAVFLESMLYSLQLGTLLAGIHRVLRPGGRLYAKEIFRDARPLSASETRAVEEFERVFRYRVRPVDELVAHVSAAGFEQIETADLSALVTTDHYDRAMVEYHSGLPVLSEFGKRHRREYTRVPMWFGELRARKPASA